MLEETDRTDRSSAPTGQLERLRYISQELTQRLQPGQRIKEAELSRFIEALFPTEPASTVWGLRRGLEEWGVFAWDMGMLRFNGVPRSLALDPYAARQQVLDEILRPRREGAQ